jgi:hypothetical protein
MHYLPWGDESSPRGRWGICAPALPEVLTWFVSAIRAAIIPPTIVAKAPVLSGGGAHLLQTKNTRR